MDDLELLYQTYLVTFATASALRRSGNRVRFSSLVQDVDSRSGAQRLASQLALDDATRPDAALRNRRQVVSTVTDRAANVGQVHAAAPVAAAYVGRR